MTHAGVTNLFTAGVPLAPSNVAIGILSSTGSVLTVNLTWSQNDSRCVVVYHAEVTSDNSFFSVNTSPHHSIFQNRYHYRLE